MKKALILFLLFGTVAVQAQSKRTAHVLAQSRLLVKTYFESKDAATLEKLFAPGMVYLTPERTVENRGEAIRRIAVNRNTYQQGNMKKGYGVMEESDSVIVKFFYRGKEIKPDGTSGLYTVNLVMIWENKKKESRLLRLEAIKID